MESQADTETNGETTFCEDRRGTWRVTWTLALPFVGVSWLMQRDGAALWPLFGGIALLLLSIGISALAARRQALIGIGPEGLRVHPGRAGLSGREAGGGIPVPWSAVAGVAFERRRAARRSGDGHPMTVRVLSFRLHQDARSPGGQRGLLERVSGRESELALGEHFLWNPDERSLDLIGHPSGGFAKLTAAIARAEPRLGDASAQARSGLGGPIAYAVYDAAVPVVLGGMLWLWVTGRAELLGDAARKLL